MKSKPKTPVKGSSTKTPPMKSTKTSKKEC